MLVALAGCGDDDAFEDPCAVPSELAPSADLGTGLDTFELIESGDDLVIHHGIQGGYHVFGAVQATGFYPGPDEEIERVFGAPETRKRDPEAMMFNPSTRYSVVRDDGTVLADYELHEPLNPDGDIGTRYGDIVYFDLGTMGDEIVGSVSFSLSIVDVCGATASDEVTDLAINIVEDF